MKKKEEEKPQRTKEFIEKFSNEAKEILKNSKLFEDLVAELDKEIVGEIEARKVLILCAYGGRLVENCQTASFNILVNDVSGVGKDYLSSKCLQLLPPQNFIKKTRISGTVLNYWHNAEEEPWWTWNGKVLYLEDISESILNHDVFKVMCSSGSSASIVIDKKVVDLEIIGKPVIIVTTATATPTPELVRRFVILNLDSSKNQTFEIMKRHSEFRKKGIIPEINKKIRNAMQFLNPVKVKIKFAESIYPHFPIKNIIMRTHYPRFLDFISASTGLHQFQRTQDEEGFYLATGQDYDIARECFLKLCSNRYMIPLTINQKKILQIFEDSPLIEGTVAHFNSTSMNFMSDRALSYNLSLLSQYGILETAEKINPQNKTVTIYRLCDSYKPNQKITIPTYEELCRIASLPSDTNIPTTTSLSSIPNKKDKKDLFLEVAKVPKREVGVSTCNIPAKEPTEKEIKEILTDFELNPEVEKI